MKKKAAAKVVQLSTMQTVRQAQPGIFRELDVLSKKHGVEVFRIVGQRFFKGQKERDSLRREIAEREAELAALQRKASV